MKDIVNLEQLDSLSYIQGGNFNSISCFKRPFVGRRPVGNDDAFIDLISIHPYEQVTINHVHGLDDDNLINSVARHFLEMAKAHSEGLIFKKNGISDSELNIPNKVLAVTGSPYDKFPFRGSISARLSLEPYVYLGTREKRLAGARFNRGYLSHKFDQLGASFIKLLLKPRQEYFDFSKMLDFLNISPSFILKLSLSERIRKEELNQESILNLVSSVRFHKAKGHKEIDEEGDLSIRLLDALHYVAGERLDKDDHFFEPLEILCDIDLSKEPKDKKYLSSLELLSEYDLIELEDVIFSKSKHDFLLSQASSGELSLLFTMSSIAGEIENDSLILIDEPELSLHPEWQLNFLSLLTDIFSNYKNCHFIIATHSPNIVSSIPEDNAYIVSIDAEGANLMPSKMYHNRSADFQLARVFNTPGNSNEYLIKTAINIFSKVKRDKVFDEDDLENLNFLNNIKNSIPKEDSVIELIEMLNEVYQKYGRN
ncbi:ATP-binding protein [Moritella sp. 36]|uniref:AAA family ATPase n=1 Tax=Moritella sp. 36 TaxID=2746233 RepID=UPI001BA78225|nr:AAA family ATPase [Moritella sp. 36]QUM90199.1 ATP-binding protein [Moritella sp. 36]